MAQEHWCFSGFANTDLDLQLKKHGIHKLIVIGLIAHTCVEATVRFAVELGYEVTMVKDATADYSAEGMHAALDVNIPNYVSGIVTTKEVVDSIYSLQTLGISAQLLQSEDIQRGTDAKQQQQIALLVAGIGWFLRRGAHRRAAYFLNNAASADPPAEPAQKKAEAPALPAPGTYTIDPVHTFAYFGARHGIVGLVRGRFDKVTGTITVSQDPAACGVDVTIDTYSISTQYSERDDDLRSPDYFDVIKFPTMTYHGRGIRRVSDSS